MNFKRRKVLVERESRCWIYVCVYVSKKYEAVYFSTPTNNL